MVPEFVAALMLEGDIPDSSDFLHRPPWQALAACRGIESSAFFLESDGDTTYVSAPPLFPSRTFTEFPTGLRLLFYSTAPPFARSPRPSNSLS
jgi:hypothetical protein